MPSHAHPLPPLRAVAPRPSSSRLALALFSACMLATAQAAVPASGTAPPGVSAKKPAQAKASQAAKPRTKAGSATAAKAAAKDDPWEAAHKAWLTLSPEAARLTQWVRVTGDNGGAPFAIIDKVNARVYVFDEQSALRGSSPVLLGVAKGDHTVPGIGQKPLDQVRPEERTTPAGRFVAEHGENARGEHVIWVDYEAAVSMHPVLTTNPAERRLQRLATPTAADNRISYGCINVPKVFFQSVLLKTLKAERPVVYVLPETRGMSEVFAGFPGPNPAEPVAATLQHAAVGEEAIAR